MADVLMLAKRLGVKDAKLQAKTSEYVRVATSRLSGGGLGQGELCKTAACMELASMTLGTPLDATLLLRCSGVSDQVYRSTKATLQRLLGVGSQTTARDLCIQHGCARLEQAVKVALAAYKERFVRRLPAAQQGHVDFGRPVFLASAFYLVARKNKMQVDKAKLLQPLGVAGKEFLEVQTSMADLIFDLVGVEKAKRKAADVKGNRELLDATGGRDEEDEECSSSDEEVEEEGMVGRRVNKKQQQQRDYEQWKEKVMKPAPKKQKPLSEKALRQATLLFSGAAEQPAGGKEQAALKEKNRK